MIRSKSGHIFYYVCASSKAKNKACTSHCIRMELLENAVMVAIRQQMAIGIDIEKSLSRILTLPNRQEDVLHKQIAEREQEILSCEKYKRSLYEDYKDGIISKEDYIDFGRDYAARIKALRQAVNILQEEAALQTENGSQATKWLAHFTRYETQPNEPLQLLTRPFTVNFIKRIEVFNGKRLMIHHAYPLAMGV